MQGIMLSLLGLGMLMCLAASAAMWVSALVAVVAGRPIIAAEPRRRYPGGLPELLIAFGLFIVVTAALTGIFLGRSAGAVSGTAVSGAAPAAVPDLSRLIPLIVINSVATMVASAVVIGWMRLQQFGWTETGLRPRRHHLTLGVRGLVMLLPPVLLIQALLSTIIPYSHPVLEILDQPQPVLVIAVMAISSTLVAPLAEEFFFHGLLQGWFECLAGVGAKIEPDNTLASATTELPPGGFDQPYIAPTPVRESHMQLSGRPVWPMILSSFAFALVHFGQGPAPITLFFLALGIGYLYRQTGSIWPGIVIHMGLNGLTTTVTILTMMG